MLSALGPAIQPSYGATLRLVQTKIFGSLATPLSSKTRYLDQSVIRDIPYPDTSALSATGNLLFMPDDHEEYSIREVLRSIAITEAYQRLNVDGFIQNYILERNVIDNYVAQRVQSACAKLRDCERLIDLDPS